MQLTNQYNHSNKLKFEIEKDLPALQEKVMKSTKYLTDKEKAGAAKAYVSAMSIGIAGARAGTPVPFTPKARRRKFRKSLYTRAGYHRTTVGGHH